jgi:hypothetical protein
MTREIKPSTSTKFPVGSKVKVLNTGHCYSGYQDMAKYMCLNIHMPFNPFVSGEVGTVIAKAQHENLNTDVLAVRVERGIGLIDVKGVVEHVELKPIKYHEFKEGQVVRFTKFPEHQHWKFVVGQDYTITEQHGSVGPMNARGEVPSCNWGRWEWVLVSEAPQIGKDRLPEYELAPLSREVKELTQYFAVAPDWATHVGSDNQGVHFFDHAPHVFQGRGGHNFVKGLLPNTHKHKLHNYNSTETLKAVVIKRPVVVEQTIDEVKAELATVKGKLWEAEQKLAKIKATL